MKQSSLVFASIVLAFASLLSACGSPLPISYDSETNAGLNDNETNGNTDLVEKVGVIVEESELRGLYPDKEALIAKAEEVRFPSCIRLDGSSQIFVGFAPCVDARTLLGEGKTPVASPPPTTSHPPRANPTPVPQPNPGMPGPIIVPPPVNPNPINSACGPKPKNVTIVNTGSMVDNYTQTIIRPSSPNEVVAFKVTVPTGAIAANDFRSTKLSSTKAAKFVSVSVCPGEYRNPVGGNSAGCTKYSYESSRVYLTSNQSASPRSWCVLTPGQTYYINAVSVQSMNGTTATCTSSEDCGFYAARQPQ